MAGLFRHVLASASRLNAEPIKHFRNVTQIPWFVRDYVHLRRQARAAGEPIVFGRPNPWLVDRHDASGTARGHYFHQDLWVASRIHELNPRKHMDVGSRIDGFVAHVASFREIEVLDIRPSQKRIGNIVFGQANLMDDLAPEMLGVTESLSCLHTLEHFGLGRYGDPIDYLGHLKGLRNLHGLLQPSGKLFLSVPIGPLRIEFNAHRVFSLRYLSNLLIPNFEVDQFCFVDDAGDFHASQTLDDDAISNNCGCHYGCGIWELRRRDGTYVQSQPSDAQQKAAA